MQHKPPKLLYKNSRHFLHRISAEIQPRPGAFHTRRQFEDPNLRKPKLKKKKRMTYFLLILKKNPSRKIQSQNHTLFFFGTAARTVWRTRLSVDRTERASPTGATIFTAHRDADACRGRQMKTEDKQEAVQNNRPQQCKASLYPSRTGSGVARQQRLTVEHAMTDGEHWKQRVKTRPYVYHERIQWK